MWSLRLKKKTNLRVPSFSGVVRGGCVRTRKTLGGADNFWLVITCKAGEWFTCNCLSTCALFSWTTSTTHSYYIIIIINSSLIIFSSTDQNPRYSNLLRIQLADQRAVVVTLPILPLVSRLVQRIFL